MFRLKARARLKSILETKKKMLERQMGLAVGQDAAMRFFEGVGRKPIIGMYAALHADWVRLKTKCGEVIDILKSVG